jgi:uncharacterized protein YndB with AHSA1/START domain
VTKKNELADRVLEITRIFDAPHALVFAAWTDPAHLKHWMGPRDHTAVELGGELQQGGAWRQAVFNTRENRDGHRFGWNSSFDRLGGYLHTL